MASSKTASLNSRDLNFSSAEIGDEEEAPTVIPPIKKLENLSSLSHFKTPIKKSHQEVARLLEAVPQIDEVFSITGKVGEGTFSSVFSAEVKKSEKKQKYVLKHIIPTSHPDRIITELRCLQTIGGTENVMGIDCCIRERDHVVMVMKYFPHQKFQDYVRLMTPEETRDYMKNLLIALQQVHKFMVIHRDVKPSNFLYNRKERKYALVDFGLAQKVPKVKKTTQKATPRRSTDETQGKQAKENTPSEGRPQERVVTPPNKTVPNILRGTKRKHTSAEKQQIIERTQPKPSPGLVEIDINTFSNSGPKKSRFIPIKPLSKKHDLNDIMTQRAKRPRYQSPELIAKIAQKTLSKDVILKQKQKTMVKPKVEMSCQCFGLPQVCSVCTARPNQIAPRAGTPGFRSPEVLLKYQEQTTAVDMWAAGVIMLSILSGRYPFFHAHDDFTALAQIISIFGTEKVRDTAKTLGKHLLCNVNIKPMKLQNMCEKLQGGQKRKSSPRLQNLTKRKLSNQGQEKKTTPTRRRSLDKENKGASSPPRTTTPDKCNMKEKVGCEDEHQFPASAYNLLERLLDLNPHTRITATEALSHPFITEFC